MKIIIKQPATKAEFKLYYNLRWQVLREPWQMPVGSERDDDDRTASHYMAVLEPEKVVGVGRLHLNSASEGQIRYMAVDKAYQKMGIGRKLISALESDALEKGARTIILNSRDYAVEFYRRLGYEVVEKTYILFDSIQHYKMEKHLISE
ncbi:MAG: GNAT family N-acetyltransferase [FCB group bacterium]|nr:GNAT family N-acetyltransferase [FCB group bacterium]